MAEIENKISSRISFTKRVATKVDMTPLVDLAFLLITFFMLATSLSKPKIMEVNMPAGTITSPVKHAITLLLVNHNKICYYYGLDSKKARIIDFEKIRNVIFDYNRSFPNLTFVIKMDDKSKFGNLVDVLDEMVITNSKSYSISKFTNEDSGIIQMAELRK